MALKQKSSFIYGLEINAFNSSLDFKTSSGGPIYLATIDFGYYTLTQLIAKIKAAMEVADPLNVYTVSINRSTYKITIATSGSYLSLLFLTGPRTASSIASTIGYLTTSDLVGYTTYTATNSCGVVLIPDYVGYSYLGPDFMRSTFGAINISADGTKETIVWSVQKFFQVEFKYEPEPKVISEWTNFLTWSIQQKPLEFTPDITTPNIYYQCTLESSSSDGKGLGYTMTEMLPDFPFFYKTGMLKFRQKV